MRLGDDVTNYDDTSFYSSADQSAAQGAATADSGFWSTVGAADPAAPSGGNDYSSVVNGATALINAGQQIFTPSGAPASGAGLPAPMPSGAPSPSAAPGSAGGFMDPATCATGFCVQDLYDFSQPYVYVIGGGLLIGMALLFSGGARKAA